MVERTFLIEPRDAVIFRDGKPFSAGLSSRSVGWPMPSAVIGAIRTRLGLETGFSGDIPDRLREIEHQGPFLALPHPGGGWQLAFPAPADAVTFDDPTDKDRIEIHPLRPREFAPGEGSDLDDRLRLLFGGREGKPSARALAFWTAAFTLEWLSRQDTQPLRRRPDDIGVAALKRQRRMHVAIEPGSQTARDEMLFATEGLEFEQSDGNKRLFSQGICSRIRYPERPWATPDRAAPLGGERRLAHWSETEIPWPERPAWGGGPRLRMQLLTPGAFAAGWKPGWIGEDLYGTPPTAPGLKMKLVAAAVPRAIPVSGWDYVERHPKPTRFLAPAGSVYFFDELADDPASLWMSSICDQPQDRLDGFGLVLYGGW